MAKNLLIVESPAKAKTINRYLGSDFEVLASYGHVRDLPSRDGAVDTENGFAMHYELSEGSKKHVDKIIDRLDPGESHSEPVRVVAGVDGGIMTLDFQGDPAGLYIVEASTNLVDWEAVGTATIQGDGSFEFEDADAAKHQCRFYRVVQPK